MDGKGLSLNLKSGFQTFSGQDEDVTSLLSLAGGSKPPHGSRIVIPPLGWGLCRHITGDLWGMITNLLFISGTAGSRERGSTVLALRLGWGLCAGYEPVNGHLSSSFHSFVLIFFFSSWLGCLSWGCLNLAFVFFYRNVSPFLKSPRDSFG